MADPDDDFAAKLGRARAGDEAAAAALFPLVYEQLRDIARGFFRSRAHGATLQPTALVHEAFLRLVRYQADFGDRAHFLAVAATAMRQVLIDHARRRLAAKRGGDAHRVTLTGMPAHEAAVAPIDVLALDEAVRRLAALSPRQARLVELLYFGGLTVDEAAAALDLSRSSVEKDARQARAWLRRELETAA